MDTLPPLPDDVMALIFRKFELSELFRFNGICKLFQTLVWKLQRHLVIPGMAQKFPAFYKLSNLESLHIRDMRDVSSPFIPNGKGLSEKYKDRTLDPRIHALALTQLRRLRFDTINLDIIKAFSQVAFGWNAPATNGNPKGKLVNLISLEFDPFADNEIENRYLKSSTDTISSFIEAVAATSPNLQTLRLPAFPKAQSAAPFDFSIFSSLRKLENLVVPQATLKDDWTPLKRFCPSLRTLGIRFSDLEQESDVASRLTGKLFVELFGTTISRSFVAFSTSFSFAAKAPLTLKRKILDEYHLSDVKISRQSALELFASVGIARNTHQSVDDVFRDLLAHPVIIEAMKQPDRDSDIFEERRWVAETLAAQVPIESFEAFLRLVFLPLQRQSEPYNWKDIPTGTRILLSEAALELCRMGKIEIFRLFNRFVPNIAVRAQSGLAAMIESRSYGQAQEVLACICSSEVKPSMASLHAFLNPIGSLAYAYDGPVSITPMEYLLLQISEKRRGAREFLESALPYLIKLEEHVDSKYSADWSPRLPADAKEADVWLFQQNIIAGKSAPKNILTESGAIEKLSKHNFGLQVWTRLFPQFERSAREKTAIPASMESSVPFIELCVSMGLQITRSNLDGALLADSADAFQLLFQNWNDPKKSEYHIPLAAQAARSGAVRCLTFLLDTLKISVHAEWLKMPLLHHACSIEQGKVPEERIKATIALLADRGANIEQSDATELLETPILKACRHKHFLVVSYLASRKANPYGRAGDGHSLLSLHPAEMIPFRIVPGLTSAAPVSFFQACSPGDAYLLHYLIANQHAELLSNLCPRRNDWDFLHVDKQSGLNVLEAWSSLMEASNALQAVHSFVKKHQRQALPHLLASISVRCKSVRTIESIIRELEKQDKTLLNHKARPYGNSPLHNLASNGHLQLLDLIIQSGADTNIANDKGETPLHLACAMTRPKLDIIQWLVAAGSNLAALSKNNETPLLKLCRSTLPTYNEVAHRPVFLFLIQNCSLEVLNTADASGLTAIAHAANLRNISIIADLLAAGCTPLNIPITLVCVSALALEAVILGLSAQMHPETLNRLLNEWDPTTGHSALVIAAKHNNLQCFQMLLDAGANPDIPDKNGKRPIDFLQNPIHRDGKAIKALLDKRAEGKQ